MKYRITCKSCKGHSDINIDEHNQVVYVQNLPIISCRLRGDMQWGFECFCGNDTRLAKQEMAESHLLIKGSSDEVIAQVIDRMNATKEDNFIMEKI